MRSQFRGVRLGGDLEEVIAGHLASHELYCVWVRSERQLEAARSQPDEPPAWDGVECRLMRLTSGQARVLEGQRELVKVKAATRSDVLRLGAMSALKALEVDPVPVCGGHRLYVTDGTFRFSRG